MITPVNNKTNLKDLFDSRQRYSDLYSKYNSKKIESIDLWNNSTYYGRIDTSQQPVIPNDSSLKTIANSNIVTLIPVAEAFEDLKNKINKDITIKKITPNSLYTSLNPSDGYKNVILDYKSYVSDFFNYQATEFNTIINNKNNILFFDDYVSNFIELTYYTNFITTLSNFVLYKSPMYSGIIIDLVRETKTDDQIKLNYLRDTNFNYMLETAELFGFRIDKNIPWRLIFNIESVLFL